MVVIGSVLTQVMAHYDHGVWHAKIDFNYYYYVSATVGNHGVGTSSRADCLRRVIDTLGIDGSTWDHICGRKTQAPVGKMSLIIFTTVMCLVWCRLITLQ